MNYRKAEAESKKSRRDNSDFRQIERQREHSSKRKARKDQDFTKRELAAKREQDLSSEREARKDDDLNKRELAAKREVRKDMNYRKADAESKKSQRDYSDFRQKERQREHSSKREARKDEDFTKRELAAKKEVRKDNNYRKAEAENKSGTISVKLKKKLAFKKCDFSGNVRPFAVICVLHYLMRTSDLYKSSGIEINKDWITEIAKINEEETQNEKSSTQEDNRDLNDTDDYSDHFSEVDENETHVGNTDTLLDYIPDNNPPCDTGLTFAPGEGRRPSSLYSDPDAEYLSFPTIFCDQRRPDNKERSVSVHYTDIVKWELRSMDRQVAQSVPNIFFKLQKIQLKNISDKVNFALKRCQTDGKKWTAKDVLNPNTVNDIVRLDEETVILEPLKENDDIEKYKAIYKEIQNEINSLHSSEDIDQMTYKMFLDDVLQMNDEEYSKAIKSILSGPKVFLKQKPSEVRVNAILENWCLADYVSQLELQYPKTSESSDHENETEQQENESESENENEEAIEENSNKINTTLKNGIRIYQRKTPKVIRYVKYNYKTDSENFYREYLMLFYPSRNEVSDLQCGHETYEQMYLTVSRLLENKAKQYEGKVTDLEKPIEEAENDCNENDQVAPGTQQVEIEDAEIGPTESEQYVHFNPDRPIEHRQYDVSSEVGIEARTVELTNHANRISGAGCGKSVVVKAIFQALHRHLCSTGGEDPDDIRILLCALTGKAAYNINGLTIHNAFQVQPNKGLYQSLSCDVLNTRGSN
ncbi:unnamed protein product [Mytilus coruscus]|uniref:DNA helicase n=1 Tax=Mytilus coruscus TaxID=42192 RepID=A0A6J8B0F7_MYTCO|nr:unnamed protein product [Mytilus coruscus]